VERRRRILVAILRGEKELIILTVLSLQQNNLRQIEPGLGFSSHLLVVASIRRSRQYFLLVRSDSNTVGCTCEERPKNTGTRRKDTEDG